MRFQNDFIYSGACYCYKIYDPNMVSDILTGLRNFLLDRGIEKSIYDFKNPCLEAMTQNQAQYNEATESLTLYQYNLTDENGIEYPGPYKIVITLESGLKNELNKYKASIISIINKVSYNIRIEEANKAGQLTQYLEVIYKDIHIIREQFHNNQLYIRYKSLFDTFFDELLSQENQTIKKKEDNACQKLSYVHFHTNVGNLTDLCKSLKDYDFIDSSVNPIDFKNAFGGNKELTQKIYWKGSLSALYYFINTIFSIGVIDKEIKGRKWQIAKALFCHGDGTDITEDLGRQKKPGKKDLEQLNRLVKVLEHV